MAKDIIWDDEVQWDDEKPNEHKESFGQLSPDINLNPVGSEERKIEEVDSMPWFAIGKPEFDGNYPLGVGFPADSQSMIAAGRETSKIIDGIKDVGDALSLASYIPASLVAKMIFPNKDFSSMAMKPIKNIVSRELNNRQERKDMAHFEKGVDLIPNILGGSLPYLLSNQLAGPSARALGKGVTGAVEAGIEGTKAEGRSILNTVGTKLSNSSMPLPKAFGTKIMEEWVNPMLKAKADKLLAKTTGAASTVRDPMYENLLNDLVGGTFLGATEGALHKDNTAAGGALNSLAGGVGGAIVKSKLTRLPNYYRPREAEIVDWAKGKGYGKYMLPGMETGSGRLQMFETGMKNSRTLGDVVRRSDMAMDQNTAGLASMAMGVKDGKQGLTPDVIQKHLSDIGNEYDELVEGTKIYIEPSDKIELQNHFKALKNDPSPMTKDSLNLAQGYYDWLDKLSKPSRDPFTGQMRATDFNGNHYQEFRKSLKGTIDKAAVDGDYNRVNILKPILKTLDDGTEKGIIKYGSEAQAAQWKDLNERNAMTYLVLEHGFDPLRGANMAKLGNYFIGSDPVRLATQNVGPRLKELQNISLFELLRKRQAGGNLTGLGITHDFGNSAGGGTNQTLSQYFMQTPAAEMISPALSWYMKAYERGYPAKTGLLNLSGKNFGDTVKLGRAGAQSGSLHSTILNYLGDTRVNPLSKESDDDLKYLLNHH